MLRFGVLACATMMLAAMAPAAARAAENPCPRYIDDVPDDRFGPALTEPAALSAAKGSQQRLENFGTNRGIKQIKNIRLTADKRLPDSVKQENLAFDALIERAGEQLESVDFPNPTFSQPHIQPGRKEIKFTICLNAAGAPAGKYVGNVTLAGPEGLGAAQVGITANLKGSWVAWGLGALAAMLIAGGLLFGKDWSNPTISINRNWWFKTIGALGVTFGALVLIYLNDPAWGADWVRSAAALIGTAFASIGGRKLIE